MSRRRSQNQLLAFIRSLGSSLERFISWLLWHGVKAAIVGAGITAIYQFAKSMFDPQTPTTTRQISFAIIMIAVIGLLVVAYRVNHPRRRRA